jgi:ABC-type sugar transport system ATPase subunit
MQPRVLLISGPTRGVDIAAKAAIHALLREAADNGIAVVVASAEFDEALALGDRIVCMRHGRVAGTGHAGEFDERTLMSLAGAAG